MTLSPARRRLNTRQVALLGVFLAYTLAMSLIERLIPLGVSLPGLRLGLANVAVLLALYLFPFSQVMLLVLLKCLLAAIFSGSPASLFYSLGGSLLSLLGMALLLRLPESFIGPLGISVAGAALHNSGQILVACLLFGSWALLAYLPALLLLGLATGLIIGELVRRLRPLLAAYLAAQKKAPKARQREEALAARAQLTADEARRYSEVISRQLLAEPAFARAQTVLSYQAFGTEANPALFHEQALLAGKQLAFPLCLARGEMVAAIPDSADDWEQGKFGIKTPVAGHSRIVEPTDIELVIVPCLAFDGASGIRLGWGGGYYDRYLPRCTKAVSIAIAFEAQHLPGLCREEWDVPVSAIITEQSRYGGFC